MTGKGMSRVERLRAQLAQAEAKERSGIRRRVTHGRVVAGALLLSRPEAFGLTADAVRRALDAAVTRAHDRAALDLPPHHPEPANRPTA
jgi:hypothetical protein